MSLALKTTAQLEVQLSPQQKKLNRLIERIEQQKQELATWQNVQADIQNYTRSKLLPIYSELHTVLFTQLDTLWNHIASDAFSKADLAQIDTKIAALAKMLKKSQMLTSEQKEQVEKIDTFYIQHEEHIRAKKAKANSIQNHDLAETVEQNVDVDWENYEYDSTQYIAERERAKQLKQQEKREQAVKMAEQSLKTVYLKITAMIHPDREPDEAKKLEKTELLQKVNEAYAEQDLFYLLKLQLQLETNRGLSSKALSSEQVKFYQLALEAQGQNLQSQLEEIFTSFHLSSHVNTKQLKMSDVYKVIDKDAAELKQLLKWEKERLKHMKKVSGVEMLLAHGVL
ncbi:molecular chaperone DnaJ [Acinetobacter sp. ANC 4204]|uniref:molecular chaperone DnaJ n=1 Tax=Acinetobacter sp. ANC 4204 TaxID=1977884 RepID=UPI000A345B3C|nr:molecular chaperone DnaJ [Acinetobacter sp. ANC 4204]OTG61450.1 molecular chaperone DnaJ [Acinetobacter sp. ANC 4204]